MSVNSQAAILDRLIEPTRSDMPPETARFLLQLDFAESDRDRMRVLAAKSQDGALSPADSQELGDYVEVGHLLALMHSKARRALRKAAS